MKILFLSLLSLSGHTLETNQGMLLLLFFFFWFLSATHTHAYNVVLFNEYGSTCTYNNELKGK